MLDLLQTFSVSQILIYGVLLALAIRGIFDFAAWVKNKYDAKFHKDYTAKKKEEELNTHYEQCMKQREELLELYAGVEEKIDSLTETINCKFKDIEKQLQRLTDSDMHDIKSWIVEKHHFFINQEWIDDFQMDTIEKRYGDYLEEGGNSYVAGLMSELRALPHVPPTN